MEIAAAHGLAVVEDCAQAAGALYRGKKVGGIGDLGAFSFYPTKLLGAYGDGGMSITGDEELYRKLRRLRFYGMEIPYHSEEEGYNSRLDEVQAAILNFKLRTLDGAVLKRQRLAEQYSSGLRETGDVALPLVKEGRTHQFYTYTIRTSARDRLLRYLYEHGIEARINYQPPVHLMRGYGFLGYGRGGLPVTERLSEQALSLPLFPELTTDMVDQVTETIRAFFKQA
jgi:dTDP-4-amino-4,6-dideoxygalactose transaminase